MAFIVAGIIGGVGAIAGGIGGAAISSSAAGNAAKTQADAADRATALQKQMYDQSRADQEPWRQAGVGALSQLGDMTKNGAPSFTQEDFLKNQDPAYQWNLQQGQQAIERSAAARGGLMSGGTLKDLTNYAQGAASNEYGNAYNRFMSNQDRQFGRLSSIAGMGQGATSAMGQLGQTYAGHAGDNIMGAANASAGAQVASGNAWGGALSGIGSGIGKTFMEGSMMANNPFMNGAYAKGVPGMAPGGTGIAGGTTIPGADGLNGTSIPNWGGYA